MSDKTVQQLAEIVKIPLERLLEQLKEAGLSATGPNDLINEDEKMQLLAHLRKRHGKDEGENSNSPKRVILERRKVTEIKQATMPGSSTKTISVEVRKKKTYIKRSDVGDSDLLKKEELLSSVVASSNSDEELITQLEVLSPLDAPVTAVVEEIETELEKPEQDI